MHKKICRKIQCILPSLFKTNWSIQKPTNTQNKLPSLLRQIDTVKIKWLLNFKLPYAIQVIISMANSIINLLNYDFHFIEETRTDFKFGVGAGVRVSDGVLLSYD